VEDIEYMMGSYAPRPEPYEFVSPVDEWPSGFLIRGHYVTSVKVLCFAVVCLETSNVAAPVCLERAFDIFSKPSNRAIASRHYGCLVVGRVVSCSSRMMTRMCIWQRSTSLTS
jgi:hypothetical protein